MRNLDATAAKGVVRTHDKETHELLQSCSTEIKLSSNSHNVARANPLLVGLMMLHHHFQYLNLGGEVIMVTSRFRAFDHHYNALVQEGLLQHIPVFDELLKTYDQMIFSPSRAAAVHGAFNRTYLLSSPMTAYDRYFSQRDIQWSGPACWERRIKVRKAFHMADLSSTYRLMIEDDKSVLGCHEDIVLEADTLIDLNTSTFDTKETLAHLAAKHGHRSLCSMLSALGADLRIKDGLGRRVCDMTTDGAWVRDITDSISTLEGSQVRAEGARNRDALFRHQGSRREERLQKSVSA
ncbi:hypothetical protein PRIC2_003394 [Phytophthora ramorum]